MRTRKGYDVPTMIKRYVKLLDRIERMPKPEKRVVENALRRIKTRRVSRKMALDVVDDIVQITHRTTTKTAQDAAGDQARRCLIGARLPREEVDQYRAAAAKEGVSLYRWTASALQSAYQRHRAIYGGPDSENHKTLR